eukprot:6186884-Pleurochrysis_carterae.AAC.3
MENRKDWHARIKHAARRTGRLEPCPRSQVNAMLTHNYSIPPAFAMSQISLIPCHGFPQACVTISFQRRE